MELKKTLVNAVIVTVVGYFVGRLLKKAFPEPKKIDNDIKVLDKDDC